MVSNNIIRSDLPRIHNIVQNAMIMHPKEMVIATLRDFFSRDSWYHFATDVFGFPETPDHTDLDRTAGLNDNLTTRVFIGEAFRYDIVYYPAIIVRFGGSNYVPISMNRETGSVQWDYVVYEDGYGNSKAYKVPKFFIFAGAWEGSISVDVLARDLRARDDLTELVSLLFTDIAFNDLQKEGIVIKGVSISSPSETLDRTDMLFKQTITLQIRSEWRRMIPIGNIIEIINMIVEFGRVDVPNYQDALNLRIKTNMNLTEIITNL